jgi:serine/threonine protein kinase
MSKVICHFSFAWVDRLCWQLLKPSVTVLVVREHRMAIGETFTLDGIDYTIAEKIEDGGFSEVFKATASKLFKRPLAVKILLSQYASDAEWRKRFEREARILANIDHPHVVRIRATLTRPDGSFAIIQDFVENAASMREYFKSTQEPDKHLSVALQVLYGLREAHTSGGGGAIHRDLSPSNVLVNADGHARIIDFGLAKGVESNSKLTMKGPGYGTPGCVSPEQAKDFASATHLTDFYALGKGLAASYQDREPEHAECSKLPEPWQAVCVKMTSYDAADRHQDCEEAIEDLFNRFIELQDDDGNPVPICPSNMKLHAQEISRWETPPASWVRVVRHWINAYDYDGAKAELHAVLELLSIPVVTDGQFDLISLFPFFEEHVWESLFGGSFHASFGSTDGLGTLLLRWLPNLDVAGKLMGFRRLVRTAVRYNRFSVMGDVRQAFSGEGDERVRAQYLEILQAEDPGAIIHGGGLIPGRIP